MKKSFKLKINFHNFLDIFMCVFVCTFLSFRDYTNVIIVESLLLLASLVFNRLKTGRIKKHILKFGTYKLLFIILCIISSIWSSNNNIDHLCISMIYRVLICLCVLVYVDSEKNFVKLLKFCIIGSCILCIRMIIVIHMSAWGNARVGNFLSHDPDNSYGNTGITYVLGVFSAILIGDKDGILIRNNKMRFLLTIIFTIFSLMSGSKKQIFIILIALAILFYIKSDNPLKLIKNLFIFIIIFCITYFSIMHIQIFYDAIGYRIQSFLSFFGKNNIANTNDLSTLSRFSFLKDAYSTFLKHPFIGVGIDSFKYFNTLQFSWAECNYLEILADLGVLGFAIYYIPHIKIMSRFIKLKKRKDTLLIINTILFIVLLFIDATMVSYNEAHLQFYLSIVYAYCFLINKSKGEDRCIKN